MKKLLIGLMFLLTLTNVKALTYNCTEVGQQIICSDCICKPPECPTCPILPNETIIIQNLTMPEQNITCNFDPTGFVESMGGCIDSLGSCRDSLTSCDSQITNTSYLQRDLSICQSQLSVAQTEKSKAEKGFSSYGLNADYLIILIVGGAIGYFYFKQQMKPAATARLVRE